MNSTDDSERRIGGRLPVTDRVMVVRGESAWFAELLDLSEGGCSVAPPPGCSLEEEEVVRLFFYRSDDTPPVIVPARIARVAASLIGIEYQEPQSVPPGRTTQ